ncbi:alkanesulfonate monooxygenase SsuD/methylene tetrahydromethanopterin reductase-like flavin-dependent oxidoreductase (luciferase family) [Gracilibacillus halotolerans]|uniref:Alkanesulfonate monooxygenase SsuD/methylene tetrahydromethanopterin reductase-like flavin-dependent oxidoreductase (Luciferase family) n=1 Tax=Gracilibacillus halotolerans TaxID=74386 RepID=A0A841RGI1_9BACI|nr:LLM class flavin-dependent oxidoreductase [Gracilibacillus halotolerans]MBB6513230.1 alkanesulfonate monooxygenase SsuD/methylene tetrahydromethanopterin reductase-like flavin-dependent oxidoreductase (luciferase family) [Gracilibacillus halotolerans]
MEFGVFSLGEQFSSNGQESQLGRIQELIHLGNYADELGIDLFGVGEHHRLDYVSSSPQLILSYIAASTKQIKLTALTSLLGTTNPVRLYEDFATLDLLSKGRAEITVGRGAFNESFHLFGYDENKYDDLFDEHLQILLKANKEEKVNWKGDVHHSLVNAEVSPRAYQSQLPVHIGVSGTKESAIRAAKKQCGLAVIMLGGTVKRYTPIIDAYNDNASSNNRFVSIAAHTFIRETEEEIENEFYPLYAKYWKHLMENGIGGPMGMARTDLEFVTSKESTLLVGTPAQVIEKIKYQQTLFNQNRMLLQVDFGGQSLMEIKKTVKLLAERVIPEIKKMGGAAHV